MNENIKIVGTEKEKSTVLEIIQLIQKVPLTGEQLEYILTETGNREQMVKQLADSAYEEIKLNHRLAMIVDDARDLRKNLAGVTLTTDVQDCINNNLLNIEIAADLDTNECFTWKLYSEATISNKVSTKKLVIFKAVKDVVEHPENYEQCLACGNPVDKRHKVDGCPNCGSHYFEPESEKDFSNLVQDLPPNEEIEV